MLETGYKFGEVHDLYTQIEISADRVNFKNIFTTSNGGVTLVSFNAGQKLDTHTAPVELMVTVLEGEIKFTILDKPHSLHAGQFLLLGNGIPHSVVAITDAKMILTKIKA